jgi:dGTPase
MIGDCVKQVLLAEEVRDGPLFIIPEFLRPRVEVLKQLTWFYVIDNRAIKIQQQGQRKVVRELFEANYKAAGSADRDLHGILAESHLYLFDDSPDEAARARVVANLISSMTERQLLMTHKRLTGIELGSITDLT